MMAALVARLTESAAAGVFGIGWRVERQDSMDVGAALPSMEVRHLGGDDHVLMATVHCYLRTDRVPAWSDLQNLAALVAQELERINHTTLRTDAQIMSRSHVVVLVRLERAHGA